MTPKQRAALEQATQVWNMWEQLHAAQEEWIKRKGSLASWPRDVYEAFLDDLATNAKEALEDG